MENEKNSEIFHAQAQKKMKLMDGGKGPKNQIITHKLKQEGPVKASNTGGGGVKKNKRKGKGSEAPSTTNNSRSEAKEKPKKDPSKTSGIKKDVIEYRMKKGLCISCGQEGHMVADCPGPKKLTDSKAQAKDKGKEKEKKVATVVAEQPKEELSYGKIWSLSEDEIDPNDYA